MDAVKNVLGNLSLLGGGGAAEVVKVAVEPVIDLLVDLVVMVADFFAGFTFFHGFGFGRGAVLVSAAYVNGVVANKAAVASEDIGRKHTSDDVAEMRNVVHVR